MTNQFEAPPTGTIFVDHSDPFGDVEFEEYQSDKLRTTVAGLQREAVENSNRWFPTLAKQGFMFQLMYHGLGLGGEAGEVSDDIKKLARLYLRMNSESFNKDEFQRVNDEFTTLRDAIATEIGDVFAYLCNIAGLLGVDLEDEYRKKAAFNETRDWVGGAG